MSLGKLPGIKGLMSGSQGKRRFKSDLSVDMISPPLGDFRHTMHVGRGGDVFGDTSFLSNYGGNREPGSPDSASSSKSTGFFTRTFRHVRKTSGPRPRAGSRDLSSPPPDISPIIKNAVSLPQLNVDSANGCLQRVDLLCFLLLFPGVHSGFVTLPRLSRLERQFHDDDTWKPSSLDNDSSARTRSDSLTSFTVDLGPSLMTEVFSLIDNASSLLMSNHSQAAGEEEEEEEDDDDSSLTETPVQTPTVSSPNSSMFSDCTEVSEGIRSHTQVSRFRCLSDTLSVGLWLSLNTFFY
uniref:CDC42 effector protein (Rho GTPase binding) 1b n=1 Tax=Kryptolebias marmoratus TaxID=37003 RepID=A0A3Q3B5V1_KRYMA